jgi:hypothetical protein
MLAPPIGESIYLSPVTVLLHLAPFGVPAKGNNARASTRAFFFAPQPTSMSANRAQLIGKTVNVIRTEKENRPLQSKGRQGRTQA